MIAWRKLFALWLSIGAASVQAQNSIEYRLHYEESAPGVVRVTIVPHTLVKAPVELVMPRTYPGGYEQEPYDSFVENVAAFSREGKPLRAAKEVDGPRWSIGHDGDAVASISYRVDIQQMETQMRSAVTTSKTRSRYMGVLGYSVFAFMDGFESQPVELRVEGPKTWPILSTLDPVVPAQKGAKQVKWTPWLIQTEGGQFAVR